MNDIDFKSFFKLYSKNVDNANSIGFWKLSDQIIQQIILDNVPDKDNETITILDAGGGTGRWACNLSKLFQGKFVVYDKSEDMLDKAKENIAKNNLNHRIEVKQGDMTEMSSVDSNSINYIISIYSPISFIYEKEEAFKELYRILKPGGTMLIMGHGYYNAIYSKINNYHAKPDEVDELVDNQFVKWAEYVPKLNVFSKEIMEADLEKSGFKIKKTYGIPVFVQPGPEDFDPNNGKISSISKALENEKFFKKVFEKEMQFNSNSTVSNRGVNIFSVATKE